MSEPFHDLVNYLHAVTMLSRDDAARVTAAILRLYNVTKKDTP